MGSADALCVPSILFASKLSLPFRASPESPAGRTFLDDDGSPLFAKVAGSPALSEGAVGSSGAAESVGTLG